MMLFKLEIMDHKARERAGLIIPTFSAPIPVVLKPDSAMEVNTLTFTCYELVYAWSSKVLLPSSWRGSQLILKYSITFKIFIF